jgi:flagellar protein FliO/FliZ
VNTLHSMPAQAVSANPVAGEATATPDPRFAGAAGLFAQKLRDSLGLRQRPTP